MEFSFSFVPVSFFSLRSHGVTHFQRALGVSRRGSVSVCTRLVSRRGESWALRVGRIGTRPLFPCDRQQRPSHTRKKSHLHETQTGTCTCTCTCAQHAAVAAPRTRAAQQAQPRPRSSHVWSQCFFVSPAFSAHAQARVCAPKVAPQTAHGWSKNDEDDG